MGNKFEVNYKNTRTTSRRRFGVFIVNFEHILYQFFIHNSSSVSIIGFEQAG